MDMTTVLVPLDGSAAAEAALPYAEAIARAVGVDLQLFAVADRSWAGMVSPEHELHGELERMHRERPQAYLAATAAALGQRGIASSCTVADGDPAAQIIAHADGIGAGMIVMATHGHGRISHSIIGGVADKVMRTSHRPLLLVQPPEEQHPPDGQMEQRSIELRSLMVPLDGSEAATAALAPAAELAGALGASITLVRVEPFLSHWLTGFESPPDTGAAEENITQAGIEYLDSARALLPADLQVDTLLLRGGVDANLTEYAEHQGVDLVVMTTHGHGGLRDRILGSTTDRLIRSGAPVLLIRPAE